MPPITKIQKEDILEVAYQILKEKGIEGVNARAIAKKLNCSVQPIFHKFGSMEALKKSLLEKVLNVYHTYMQVGLDSERPYLQIGKNYIHFAKEEPKLFQLIFMTKTGLSAENFVTYDSIFSEIEKHAGNSTKLKKEDIKAFHIKMWTFTHGIATLVASNTCEFTEEQIHDLLVEEYQALIKLEESRGKINGKSN